MPSKISNTRQHKRFINDNNIVKFKTAIQLINWSAVFGSTTSNEAYGKFHELFNNAYEMSIPLRVVKTNTRTNNRPWLTPDLLSEISLKNKMYKRLKVDGEKCVESDYKS